MGDNVGGGSPADGTLIAHGLLNHQIPRSFVCLYDPESVDRAKHSGIGSRIILEMGGKTDDLHGPPLSPLSDQGQRSDTWWKDFTRDWMTFSSPKGLILPLRPKTTSSVSWGFQPQSFRLSASEKTDVPL